MNNEFVTILPTIFLSSYGQVNCYSHAISYDHTFTENNGLYVLHNNISIVRITLVLA